MFPIYIPSLHLIRDQTWLQRSLITEMSCHVCTHHLLSSVCQCDGRTNINDTYLWTAGGLVAKRISDCHWAACRAGYGSSALLSGCAVRRAGGLWTTLVREWDRRNITFSGGAWYLCEREGLIAVLNQLLRKSLLFLCFFPLFFNW